MTLSASEIVRPLRVPGYVVAVVLAVMPLFEVGVRAWPPRWHEPPWRLAAISTVGGAATTMLFALFLLLAIGALAGDRATVWLALTISAVATTLSIVGAGAFALDSLQMRGQLQPAQLGRYTAESLWELSRICVTGVAFLVLTLSAFRSAKQLHTSRLPSRRSRTPLVAGPPPVGAGRPPVASTPSDASTPTP
jgi:hypothetical protein